MRGGHLAQSHESANHEDRDVNGARAVEQCGRHQRTVLSEYAGRVSPPAMYTA